MAKKVDKSFVLGWLAGKKGGVVLNLRELPKAIGVDIKPQELGRLINALCEEKKLEKVFSRTGDGKPITLVVAKAA